MGQQKQYDYEITYEKGGKTRKQKVTRKKDGLDCPGCGGPIKLECGCGTKSTASMTSGLYKARC